METRAHFFIGGEFVSPAGTGTIEVTSAHTGQVVARVPDGTAADMDRAVAAARGAFTGEWSRTTPAERGALLTKLSGTIQARMDDFARTISTENGTPFSFSQMGQVYTASMVLDYYAALAETFPFEELRRGIMGPALVRREPVGVAAAIVPWNAPLFLTVLKLAPALLAGATLVVKPAPETALDSYLLADCLAEVGLPAGVVNIVPAGREAGEHLVSHPDVDKISFTGSTAAGRRVGGIAGEQLKRSTLELGGKSAAVVLPDADLDVAVPAILGSGFMMNGQACVAQSRVLVQRDRYQETVDALCAWTAGQVVGDPLDPATQVGPLVSERQRDRVEGFIATAQREGARAAIGGGRPLAMDSGWYVDPTIMVDVEAHHTIAQEEVFGPVVSVLAYDTPEQAVAIANDSAYGLSGSVFTADLAAGIDIARQVRTGTYTVNGATLEFAAPFGGFKNSGLGRELGEEGLLGYLETKTISLPHGAEVPGVPQVGA